MTRPATIRLALLAVTVAAIALGAGLQAYVQAHDIAVDSGILRWVGLTGAAVGFALMYLGRRR